MNVCECVSVWHLLWPLVTEFMYPPCLCRRGESEKIVRCLFDMGRICAPSVVFLDEVDALVTSRDHGDHEASRRLKTELFTQMDGIASTAVRMTALDPCSLLFVAIAPSGRVISIAKSKQHRIAAEKCLHMILCCYSRMGRIAQW